jgi:hypothetical protein
MIFNPANFDKMAIIGTNNSANIFLEFTLKRITNQWQPIFCAEYDMICQFGECAHGYLPVNKIKGSLSGKIYIDNIFYYSPSRKSVESRVTML